MAFYRRWLQIGAGKGAGVISLIGLFAILFTAFDLQIVGTDDVCDGTVEDPCLSYINISNPTKYNIDIYNPDNVDFEFSPSVKEYYLFRKDGRCKGGNACAAPNGLSLPGWNFIDFTNETKPRSDTAYVFRFRPYTTHEFLLYALKHDPSDVIKYSLGAGEGIERGWMDPVLDARPNSLSLFEQCSERTVQQLKYAFETVERCDPVYSNYTLINGSVRLNESDQSFAYE